LYERELVSISLVGYTGLWSHLELNQGRNECKKRM